MLIFMCTCVLFRSLLKHLEKVKLLKAPGTTFFLITQNSLCVSTGALPKTLPKLNHTATIYKQPIVPQFAEIGEVLACSISLETTVSRCCVPYLK